MRYNDVMNEPATSKLAISEQYVELWNLDNGDERRRRVSELFAASGRHISAKYSVAGWDEMVARVTRSHELWNVNEACTFRLRGHDHHHGVMRLVWEMVD